MLQIMQDGYRRVNKCAARKRYNNGSTIYMIPHKCRINNKWFRPYAIQIDKPYQPINPEAFITIVPQNSEFDTIVKCYEYYNCNSDCGNYAAYYIKEA